MTTPQQKLHAAKILHKAGEADVCLELIEQSLDTMQDKRCCESIGGSCTVTFTDPVVCPANPDIDALAKAAWIAWINPISAWEDLSEAQRNSWRKVVRAVLALLPKPQPVNREEFARVLFTAYEKSNGRLDSKFDEMTSYGADSYRAEADAAINYCFSHHPDVAAAVATERERCAKVADDEMYEGDSQFSHGYKTACINIANGIRKETP